MKMKLIIAVSRLAAGALLLYSVQVQFSIGMNRHQFMEAECPQFHFHNYVPSMLEDKWRKQSLRCGRDTKTFCKCSQADNSDFVEWLRFSKGEHKHPHLPDAHQSPILKFVFQRVCRGQQEVVVTAIEPLADGLRYPGSLCGTSLKNLVNKSYMILAANHSSMAYQDMVYMDLGASLYKSGLGGASQEWFIDSYAQNNLRPSRMFLWEAKPHPASDAYKDVPSDLLFAYQWINLPASANRSSPANPLNILKKVASHEDFVALKIDIDNGRGELEFIAQIQSDESLRSLIDEFFF